MKKPRVFIIGTGGTIAGKAASKQDNTGYAPGAIGVRDLIEAVPEITEHAEVTGEQFCNIGSFDLTPEVWVNLACRVNEVLADEAVDGVVITHGTDTIEETAYFLNLTVKSHKPVVLVGAMRPATAISADGPLNLLNGVILAGSQVARGKGVLVQMNDQINNAREVTKTNTIHVETFKSYDLGFLGYFQNGEPHFYRVPSRAHTLDTPFEVHPDQKLPRVDIVYMYGGADQTSAKAFIDAGAKGLVVAGFGHGNIFVETKEFLKEAVKNGIAVVRSSRTGTGMVTAVPDYDDYGFVAADTLNAQKARILLMLALTQTNKPEDLREIFARY